MSDHRIGIVQGLSMALFIAESNRKNPKQIERRLEQVLRDLTSSIGHDSIDDIQFDASYDRKSKLGR